jgi:hypothetical protein
MKTNKSQTSPTLNESGRGEGGATPPRINGKKKEDH